MMIGLFDVIIAIVVVGGIGGTLITLADKVFGTKQKQAQMEAKAAQERVRTLEAQLLDAHRQNEQLQKQLEWHTKMLETQDRLVKQLTDSSHAAQPHSERPAVSQS